MLPTDFSKKSMENVLRGMRLTENDLSCLKERRKSRYLGCNMQH